jgi:hypothetical protein
LKVPVSQRPSFSRVAGQQGETQYTSTRNLLAIVTYRRLLLVSLVIVGLFGSAMISPSSSDRDGTPPGDRVVAPDETTTALWPHTSRSRSVDGRTLAPNVIVYGQPDRVKRAFVRRSDANWTTIDGDAAVGEPDWESARGAARYTCVRTVDGDGRWVRSAYQLGTGTYLGSRVHVRTYTSPAGPVRRGTADQSCRPRCRCPWCGHLRRTGVPGGLAETVRGAAVSVRARWTTRHLAHARTRPPDDPALLAAAGLGVGIVLETGSIGVDTVPANLVFHRVALVGAVGLFTLGVARGDRRSLLAGVVAWLAFLAAPLIGVV